MKTNLPKPYQYIKGYIVHANIKLKNLPDSVSVNDQKLVLKEEFHITMVAAARIAESIDPANAQAVEAEIIEEFRQYCTKHKIDKFTLIKKSYFAAKDIRKTVVVFCDVPDASGFFKLLSKKYNHKIPVQPFHITLYSLKKDVGLSISSDKEREAITTPIDAPELSDIQQA